MVSPKLNGHVFLNQFLFPPYSSPPSFQSPLESFCNMFEYAKEKKIMNVSPGKGKKKYFNKRLLNNATLRMLTHHLCGMLSSVNKTW